MPRLMGLGTKRVDTTDSEGRTTRSWELDVEEGVKELSSFRYSVRMVEDVNGGMGEPGVGLQCRGLPRGNVGSCVAAGNQHGLDLEPRIGHKQRTLAV